MLQLASRSSFATRCQRLGPAAFTLTLVLAAAPAWAAPTEDSNTEVEVDADTEVDTDTDTEVDADLEAEPEPDPERPRWTFQIDPLTTALGYVHFQIERAIGDHASIYFGPSFRLYNGILDLDAESTYIGIGAELGVRWFVVGGAPKGWWVQARGVLAHLTAESGVTSPGGYVSVLGGYTAIFGGWFVLSGGLGAQYIHYTVDGLGTRSFFPAAHTALGFAF